MCHVFLSYCRADLAWVEDELLPLFRAAGVRFFMDDAERRCVAPGAEDLNGYGLQAGDRLSPTLEAALSNSHHVVLVLSPEYFSSESCRAEIAWCEPSPDQPSAQRLIPLKLRTDNRNRLDLPKWMDGLFVDLTDVRNRAGELEFALKSLCSEPDGLVGAARLSRASLWTLFQQKDVALRFKSFRAGFETFRDRIQILEATKKVHDEIQDAQKALKNLGEATTIDWDSGQDMMLDDVGASLVDTYRAAKSKALAGTTFVWLPRLRKLLGLFTTCFPETVGKEFRALGKEIGDEGCDDFAPSPENTPKPIPNDGLPEDGFSNALMEARAFLIHSTVASGLNRRILEHSQQLRANWIDDMRSVLHQTVSLPWSNLCRTNLEEFSSVLDAVADAYAILCGRIDAHNCLQSVEDHLIGYLNTPAGEDSGSVVIGYLEDIEAELSSVGESPFWLPRVRQKLEAVRLAGPDRRRAEMAALKAICFHAFYRADRSVIDAVEGLIDRFNAIPAMASALEPPIESSP